MRTPFSATIRRTDISHPSGVFRSKDTRCMTPALSVVWQRRHCVSTVLSRMGNPAVVSRAAAGDTPRAGPPRPCACALDAMPIAKTALQTRERFMTLAYGVHAILSSKRQNLESDERG